MPNHHVAVVVAVPEEHFPDEDDICLTAGNFVCARLEAHLQDHGHDIPDWIKGGCEEDWGVYFESRCEDETFCYHICFFPGSSENDDTQMVIQYSLKVPFLKRLFSKPRGIDAHHDMHETMRKFGQTFDYSRMLTQSQFDDEF